MLLYFTVIFLSYNDSFLTLFTIEGGECSGDGKTEGLIVIGLAKNYVGYYCVGYDVPYMHI